VKKRKKKKKNQKDKNKKKKKTKKTKKKKKKKQMDNQTSTPEEKRDRAATNRHHSNQSQKRPVCVGEDNSRCSPKRNSLLGRKEKSGLEPVAKASTVREGGGGTGNPRQIQKKRCHSEKSPRGIPLVGLSKERTTQVINHPGGEKKRGRPGG